ncbi:MAG: hypothetical protein ACJARO_002318, partial [Bacteriovoracaceae bacterium]
TQKVVFSYQDKKTVVKRYSSATGSRQTSIDGVVMERTDNMSFPLDTKANMKLIMLNKETIHLHDEADGISQSAPAKIKTSFGKISKLTIQSEIYKSLYSEQLQALGVNLFGTNSIEADEMKLDLTIDLSDFVCEKEDSQLVCFQEFTFKLFATDELTGKEEVYKMLDESLSTTKSYIRGLDLNMTYSISAFNKVLREIDAPLNTDGIKADLGRASRDIQKIKEYIASDISSNADFSKIEGSTAKSILKEIQNALETAYNNL